MQTVSLSEVGGLTSEILARVAGQNLILLTSDKVVGAVVLPHDQQVAARLARQYVTLVNGNMSGVRIGRLKGKLINQLTNHGCLLVLRRGSPIAILLPPPINMTQAEQGAKSYLEHLGIIIT
jgi:antitoxin (DNA-binding transcriptional repressor) of toxin-antitoxin stability system